MELTRKIEKTIDDFILNSGEREKNNIHKSLLINGLRQVGKTHTIRKCLNLLIDDLSIIVSSFKNKDFVATSIHLMELINYISFRAKMALFDCKK